MLSIGRRLQVYLVYHLKDRGTREMMLALEKMISVYSSHDFKVNYIFCDNEGAVEALRQELQNKSIKISSAAKGEHVPEIERAGRVLKERVRSYWNTLPFRLTKELLKQLVYYCVAMINLFPKVNSVGNRSPKELFTGIKTNYIRDCKIGFGEYVQVHEDDQITNTLKERTLAAISLGPVGNLQGSYKFLSLTTGKVVKRRDWTHLPMPGGLLSF